jgi:hypothetical protein
VGRVFWFGSQQGHGVPEDTIRRVWTAIALHTTPAEA